MGKKVKNRQPRRRPLLEEIEPRILYSADFAPGLVPDTTLVPDAEQRTVDLGGEFAATAQEAQARWHELVLVETDTPDYQKFVDDILKQAGDGRDIEVVLLDASKDGLQQITDILAARQDLSAVHLVSHGADGTVQLGATELNFDALLKNATQIKGWGKSLSADADILIYGCDVAQSDGKALIDALARLTGADVAASEDLTGAAAQGGNWTLEYRTGGIDTPLFISTAEQFSYSGSLATYTVTNTNDTGAGSLRQAIQNANANGGADTIAFNIAGAGVKTINVMSALPAITGTVVIDGTTQPGFASTPLIEIDGQTQSYEGLYLDTGSDGSTIKGLAINHFMRAILINTSSNNVVVGNFLGTDATGTVAKPNWAGVATRTSNNIIGGTSAADRNIISGNSVDGIQITGASGGSGNVVMGNYIGLDVTGTVDLGNTNQGVALYNGAKDNIIGGTAAGAGNVISGNNGEGVRVVTSGTTGNVVVGNLIGTNAAGTAGIANNRGVWIDDTAADNTVGGTAAGAGNVIAYNTLDGVTLTSTAGQGNSVLGNTIHSNAGLGIDLKDDGVTANDGAKTAGEPNLRMDFPVIQAATLGGTTLTVAGYIGTAPNDTDFANARVEFFRSPNAAGVNGQGQVYLGFLTADTFGNFTGALSVSGLAVGDRITGTATDPSGNTSEFALNFAVTPNTAPVLANTAVTLNPVNEDAGGPVGAVGTLISALVGGVSDADGGAVEGIAIVAADAANGTWLYSTNNGASWNPLGTPSAASSRLLAADAGTRIYFQPNANYTGTLATAITFRAWDQTSGSNGSTANLTGTFTVLDQFDTIAYSGNNGAVHWTGNWQEIGESDGPSTGNVAVSTTGTVTGGPYLEIDLSAPGIGLTRQVNLAGATSATLSFTYEQDTNSAGGQVALEIFDGSSWATLQTYDIDVDFFAGAVGVYQSFDISSYVDANTQLRFRTTQAAAGDRFFVDDVRIDYTGLGVGGTTAFSSATDTASLTVTAVNDAPTITNAATVALTGTNENTTSSGTTVNAILTGASWADVDSGALKGIAVTAVTGAGTWQYSTDGSTWTAFGSVSSSAALLLDSASQVRYVPNGQNGETATFSFKAWDQTTGSASTNGSPSTANPGAGGGSSAYSSQSAGASIVVTSVNDAPVLDNSGAMSLTGITEDASANSGDLVSAIIASAGGDRITDVDTGAVEGIAVTALVSGNGTWQYSTDGGGSWSAVGAVSNNSALLLRAVDRLRFVPDGLNADSPSLSFRAWDQSSGVQGTKVDVSTNGGSTAFSSVIETASLTVSAVNDAPVLADTVVALNAVNEDAPAPVGPVGTLISALTGGISDVDSGALGGIAITAADTANGSWWYSTDNGAGWNALGTPSAASSRLLASDAGTRIAFQPNADYNGAIATAITFRAWDRSSGSNGDVADTTANGGTTPFSSATDTASLTVNAINDAPAIGGVMGDVLTYSPDSGAQTVDQSSNAVVLDVDSSDLGGGTLAVTIAAGGNSTEDVLSVRDQGSGAGQIGFSGGNVTYGGVLIGTAMGGSAGTPLMIALNGSATPTAASALLSNVTYQNTDSVTPTIGTRTLSFTISDGDGGTSGASTAMVTVAATNPPAAADDNYSVNEDAILMADWWDTQWTRRQQITFDNFARAENLDNFPVLIALDPSNIDYAETQNGGQDLRFFDRDGTLLSYEIERWNEAGTSYVWVNVPRIDASSSADYIWMYYGNASASPAADPAQVWASSYRGVYHLTDSGVAIGESTGNVPDAINNGSTDVAGPIGGARSFDGIDDWIRIGNGVNLAASASALTVSAWVNTNDLVTDRPFIAVSVNGGVPQDSRIALEQSNGGNIRLIIRAEDAIRDVLDTTTNPLSAGSWYYVVGVVDVANDLMQIYVNGSLEVSQTTSFVSVQTSASNSDFAAMGSQDDGTSGYSQGLIDEVRLAAAARSGNWINAEYVNATGGLVTLGGAQSAPATQGVIGNDSDPDSVNLTAVLVSGPVNAAVFTFNSDGTFVYTPSLDFAGTDTFTYRVSDGANDSNVAIVTITVNPVNDAPVLADTVVALNAVNEDAPAPVGPVGTLISALTGGISDVDSGALGGIAITAADTANGSWWYSTDSGASWNALGTPSAASSRLLASDAGTRIAFQPNADYNGAIATAITFRAWDRSSGSNGGVADTTANGGTTPFSSATDTVSLTVNPVNDAPVVTAGTTTGYTESAGGVVIDNTVTVSDADDTQITGATITISAGLTAGDVLGFTNTASITGSYNAGTGVLTLSGTDTVAAYQAALRSVTYTSTSEDPTASSAARTITWQVTDANAQGTGAQTSAVVTSTLSISALADAPVVTAGATTAYTENAAAVVIDNTVAVSDGDDTQIAGATVTISAGLTAGDVLGFTNTASITGVYSAGTGVLTLSGTDTVGAYQAALRSVTYRSTSDDPAAASASRTIAWQVTDADSDGTGAQTSAPAISTVNLTALADAPVVTAGAVIAYTESAAAVAIDNTLTVTDADDTQISDATVTIAAGLTAGDVLAFVNTGTITGSYNAGTGVLTLSGTDTLAAYQAALRSVTYSSTSEDPTAGGASRTIAWQVTDGDSDSLGAQTSVAATSTVSIGAVNDDPVAVDNAAATDEDSVLNVAAPGVLADDSDIDGGALTVSAVDGNVTAVGNPVALASGALLTLNADGSYSYDPNGAFEYLGAGESDTDTFTYQVADGNGGFATATVTVTVNGINDAPTGVDVLVTIDEDASYIFVSSDFGFADADANDNLQGVRIVSLPLQGSLTLGGAAVSAGQLIAEVDIANGELVFTPAAEANGAGYASFAFRVNDGTVDAVGANTVTIDVTAVNDAPDFTQAGNQSRNEDAGAQTVAAFAAGWAGGGADEAGQVLTYNVSNDNNALFAVQPTIDATGTLTYTLAADANGVANVTVWVSDNGGTANGGVDSSASQAFTITVNAVNDAPTLAIGPGQAGAEDAGVQSVAGFAVTAPGGGPDEGGQVLTYVVSNDNNALFAVQPTLDAGGNLTYAAAPNAFGTATVTVFVADGGGTANGGVDASAAQTFTITVTPVNDTPVLGANTLTVNQSDSVVLAAANLSASDVDDSAAGLSFSVINISNGRFEYVSTPGVAITTFSQADIAGGLVRFVHDGSGNAPAYQVSVSDGALSDGPLAASIIFNPAPLVVLPPPLPVPVPNELPPEPSAPAQEEAPAEQPEGGALVRAVFSPGRIEAEAPEAQFNRLEGGGAPARRYQPVATLNTFVAGPHIDPTLQLLAAAPANLEYLPSVPVDWTTRSAFPDAAEEQPDRIQVLLEQVQMGGMALSVGVVWWASRISGLLGSLLASAPAWRHIDPLPVVGRDEDEEKKWYDTEDRDADANELAIANVLEGAHAAGDEQRD